MRGQGLPITSVILIIIAILVLILAIIFIILPILKFNPPSPQNGDLQTFTHNCGDYCYEAQVNQSYANKFCTATLTYQGTTYSCPSVDSSCKISCP